MGSALRRRGIAAVLTGGACASLYTRGAYHSRDVDFVLSGAVRQGDLDAAMAELDFTRERDRYVHPHSPFYVEFPRGPLAVGSDHRILPVVVAVGAHWTLALSATDSCRDRLAAFYHWDDRQSLAVAVEIAALHDVDLAMIRRWSAGEGHGERFDEFRQELRRAREPR